MGYIDSHGRPELIAQPFIKKGPTRARVVDTDDVADDRAPAGEPRTGTDEPRPEGRRRSRIH